MEGIIMKQAIDFITWITGHDKKTIEQMYNDWQAGKLEIYKPESKITKILRVVCNVNNVPVEQVKSNRRDVDLVTARKEYCYLSCKLTWQRWNPSGTSLKEIGEEVGIDHATVLYHNRKMENWLDMGVYKLKEKLELIEGRLRF